MTGGPEAATRLGICSVTFRRLDPDQVIAAVAGAGLECVEWGADRHVPAGDERAARRVREATEEAGLAVASYGSYYRAGVSDPEEFDAVLHSAVLLGAARIRIWAGTTGTYETPPERRRQIVEDTRRAAALAADAGVALAYEFHRNTLTDGADHALGLLDEVGVGGVDGVDGVHSYWQPPVDLPDAEALSGLDALIDRVAAVHAFSWWPGTTRLPLAAREEMWRAAFERLRAHRAGRAGAPLDVLLEFVPGDDEGILPREAATLRALVGR
ncbi:sugar phosphate isomerase/epimerase [Streptomyces bingchenggensis BCW-1]|uniref:Sugar phosphate isomerase/epimerase n=1 Tax=Streptomyces bingchenggensis (strain BCW-1) TaxID=749414 RepID=D7C046_STRBB|nr:MULTISPECIES: TIM barrel protein [Streptomyces]ADI12086.1 sugar phosphate isomerase/epimerase [Streptomyces bingchenggensis BCW-1]